MDDGLPLSLQADLKKYFLEKMGLQFSGVREKDLVRGLKLIVQEMQFTDLEAGAEWLLTTPMTPALMETISCHLTIGETYFFRDPPYFDILEKKILPNLLYSEFNTDRRLRVWSAGCSTGEEAYSLAISISKVFPDLKSLDLTLLATDINGKSLAQLRKGSYREWSFRNAKSEIKEQYFDRDAENNYLVKPFIKKMVTANYLNLAVDKYPSLENNTNAMNVIFCRNVLMYLSPEKAGIVVKQLTDCLAPGGWLVVSACECGQPYFNQLKTVTFSNLTFYQKDVCELARSDDVLFRIDVASLRNLSSDHKAVRVAEIKPQLNEPEDIYKTAISLYEQGQYEKVIAYIENLSEKKLSDTKVIEMLARSHANVGQLEVAKKCCEKAIKLAKDDVHIYYLYALILEELGLFDEALIIFKQILYLDRGFILAHYNLGQISKHFGRDKESSKHFSNAKSLAMRFEPEQIIPESEGITAKRLIEVIESSQDKKIHE